MHSGYEMLQMEWKKEQENLPPIENVENNVSNNSNIDLIDDSNEIPPTSISNNHLEHDRVEERDVLEEM